MLKIENVVTPSPEQWRSAIMGARNPMNSWDRSDSEFEEHCLENWPHDIVTTFENLGPNDLDLMKRLRNAGTDHRKFMRMLPVHMDIIAPFYWWKEFSTYKVGTVANSCSTMHKIAAKEFTLKDFSYEHLISDPTRETETDIQVSDCEGYKWYSPKEILSDWVIPSLNSCRKKYLENKDKKYWWQMIQLLPSSYNQRRTVMLNYEVLANIYKSRRNHKLDEWREMCEWIEGLPYSELIVGERSDGTGSESKRFAEIAQVFQKSFQEGLEEGLNENKDLVFKIPKDQISPESLELLEKGFAVDMSLGFKEE